MQKIIVSAFAFASACTSTNAILPISYNTIDDSQNRRIIMSYTNTNERSICIDISFWPNRSGTINGLNERMNLIVDGVAFSNRNQIDEYCVGECAYRVRPGGEINASIPYSDFGIPDSMVMGEKTIEFRSLGYLC